MMGIEKNSQGGEIVLLKDNERSETVSRISLLLMQAAAVAGALSLSDLIGPGVAYAPLIGITIGHLMASEKMSGSFSRVKGANFSFMNFSFMMLMNIFFISQFISAKNSTSAFGMLPIASVACIVLYNLGIYKITPARLGMMACAVCLILLVHLAVGQSLIRSIAVAFIFLICWLSLACRRTSAMGKSSNSATAALKYGLRSSLMVLLISIPMVATFFVLFPRLPIDSLRSENMERPRNGKTGLSDSLTLGSISELNKSTEPAFKAVFRKSAPRSSELYWRSVVLEKIDGATWRSTSKNIKENQLGKIDAIADSKLTAHPYLSIFDGSNYSKHIAILDGTDKKIIVNMGGQSIGLDAKDDNSYSLPPSIMNDDSLRITSIAATAYEAVLSENGLILSEDERDTNLNLPKDFNPQTQKKGRDLRSRFLTDQRIIDEVMRIINTEPYRYTLRPPALGRQAIDDFFIRTQAGFCEHYASAFVVLMRSAGIPARLVTGYLSRGVAGEQVSVSQGDAHAWTEVWLERKGWVRQDPTAFISPSRVDADASNARLTAAPEGFWGFLEVGWRSKTSSAEQFWRESMLGFDAQRQEEIFRRLGLDGVGKPLLGLACVLLMALLALLWQRFKSIIGFRTSVSKIGKISRLLFKRCQRAGLEKAPGETWRSAFMRSWGLMEEDSVNELKFIVLEYEELKYSPAKTDKAKALAVLYTRVKNFNPARKKLSPM